jgi:hypothetical protein
MSNEMEDYSLEIIFQQSKSAQEEPNLDAEKLSELLCKITDILATRTEKLELLTAERDQLSSQVEELKSQIVDAVGDGFYDGYLKCASDAKSESIYIDEVDDDCVMEESERYESNHHYAKSIADIRAEAVMDFAKQVRGAYLCGAVPAELTVYDLFQTARNYAKDSYQHESEPWTGEYAEKTKQANHDAMINNIIESTGGEI